MPDALGANRFHVQWALVESVQGQYDWSITDEVYRLMRESSVEPVMLLYNAPHWARDPAATCPASPSLCAYPPLAAFDSDWHDFVEAAAARYPDVRAIEVWNEPNIGRFWAPAPDPGRYVEILAAAHDAVATAGVTAPLLTGGLIPSGNSTTSISASEFLRQIYLQGCACDFEGIGAHPYPRQLPHVETMWNRIDGLTAVRDEQGDTATPLWITEVGVSTDTTAQAGVDLGEQGAALVRLYESIEGHDIRSFVIHRFHDVTGEGSFFNQTGIVFEDLTPKPAYCELGAMIGDPCPDAPGVELARDSTAPETILVKGPKNNSKRKRASFEFASSEPGSTFECRLDSASFAPCDSPVAFRVRRGKHTFQVRATDAADNTDPAPAIDRWKVKRR
jgi:polysaccharide biosynthesis protein PslG